MRARRPADLVTSIGSTASLNWRASHHPTTATGTSTKTSGPARTSRTDPEPPQPARPTGRRPRRVVHPETVHLGPATRSRWPAWAVPAGGMAPTRSPRLTAAPVSSASASSHTESARATHPHRAEQGEAGVPAAPAHQSAYRATSTDMRAVPATIAPNTSPTCQAGTFRSSKLVPNSTAANPWRTLAPCAGSRRVSGR